MTKRLTQFAVVVTMLALVAMPGSVWANSVNTAAVVTVNVPTILSINDNGQGPFTLTFTSAASGGLSTFQTVSYAVQANNMPTTLLAGALSAKVSATLNGIDLQALAGRPYTNSGSAGDAVLTESPVGDVTMTTSATGIMDKPASTSKILSGTATVAWRAKANRDLTAADSGQTTTLTVTLKDA